ncbi:uncharacterized protein I206_107191 [Kwoniella pini CBS 10737]|uniref:PFU domain-containing protein n=1 Tax=Kwoniella pini CBS 10737 TaxID=1296096 RepID=A0AAJ8LCX5_9TREE
MSNESDQYHLSQELNPSHQADVKAVLAISNDMIASASRDSSVGIWTRKGDSGFQLKTLLNGHHAYVNSLAFIPATDDTDAYSTKFQKLISGSWDQTARVWSKSSAEWTTDVVLEGHEQAVWGVSIVEEGPKAGCFLTADRMIFLWNKEGEVLQRFKGSPEPVRSLAILPGGNTFVSACNDNLIRIWSFEGTILDSLKGHKDYVYQVTLGSQGIDFVSCGEDHTARAWKVLHPCQTVWSVSSLPNGDIVTGGSDGRIRAWSEDKARIADQATLDAYLNVVKQAMPSGVVGDDHSGQAVQPTKLTIDIDLSDDDPPVSLEFEVGSDPRTTAEAFGNEHGLSENYINQIEAFIRAHLD